MRIKKNSVFIIIFVMILTTFALADDWEKEPLTEKYYARDLATIFYHLGFGVGIGPCYYFNYNENNTFWPIVLSLRLDQELAERQFGLSFRFDAILEYGEYTDNRTYYSESSRQILLLYVGLRKKYASAIPMIKSIIPYVSLGGGFLFMSSEFYYQGFHQALKNNSIYGNGYAAGMDVGCNFEIIENYLAINMGLKYNLHFITEIGRDMDTGYDHDGGNGGGGDDEGMQISREGKDEYYMLFYTGFQFYLF
ncbi:MAG: hypothetical protein JW827_08710 [Spirochaetes bacterium]|nr:hypothetical protein [Spirochaetota bacterium]